ncbi:MAG: hypothetical protein WKF37_19220, partial [Bryobacteraceae bacterium]
MSLYTAVQVQALQHVGDRMLNYKLPDQWMDLYNDFWLWTLGAYEVVRTMDQNSARLVAPKGAEMNAMKRHLATIR